jgi:hypothetical protein
MLSEQGSCDAAGGAEYRRVLRLWIKKKHPPLVAWFILVNANISSSERHGHEG